MLVAGGDADPNLSALAGALTARGAVCRTLFAGARTHPLVTWDFANDALIIDGERARPAALFIRHDVFASLADRRPAPAQRAIAWFVTVIGWALAHDVRMFNRASALQINNKLHVLALARECGLEIPRTLVTNDRDLLLSRIGSESLIAKPVAGGDYARALDEIVKTAPHRDGSFASPSIVQERLVPPEVRVYSIAGRFFAFNVVADVLDYRSTSDVEVVAIDATTLAPELLAGLGRLMERLQMNFGAADFKACPETGRLRFLEINDGPMFAAFDAACGGRLTAAMAEFLTG